MNIRNYILWRRVSSALFVILFVATHVVLARGYADDLPQSGYLNDDEVSRYREAQKLLQEKSSIQGIQLLQDLVRSKPKSYAALYTLGVALGTKGDFDAAIGYLSEAESVRREQKINDYAVYNALGYSHMRKGDFSRAENFLKQAYKNRSNLPKEIALKATNNLGQTYFLQQDYISAFKYFSEAEAQYKDETARRLKSLALEAIRKGAPSILEPVDKVYEAWQKRDFPLYRQQWAQSAVKFMGEGSVSYSQLMAERLDLFSKIKEATVDYSVTQLEKGAAPNTVWIGTEFSISAKLNDGRAVAQQRVPDRYLVRFSDDQKRWLIYENRELSQ